MFQTAKHYVNYNFEELQKICLKMTFSLSAASPLYPSLMPRLVDPLWFKSDVPQDENMELSKVEKEHSEWLKSVGEKEIGFPPIGKNVHFKVYFL